MRVWTRHGAPLGRYRVDRSWRQAKARSGMEVSGQWVSDLRGETAVAEVASRVFDAQLRVVSRQLRKLSDDRPLRAKPVHALRVATRRADALLRLVRPLLSDEPERACRKLRRALARVR